METEALTTSKLWGNLDLDLAPDFVRLSYHTLSGSKHFLPLLIYIFKPPELLQEVKWPPGIGDCFLVQAKMAIKVCVMVTPQPNLLLASPLTPGIVGENRQC